MDKQASPAGSQQALIVFATFPSVPASRQAVESARRAGFTEPDIATFYSGNVGSRTLTEERVTGEPASGIVASGKGVAEGLIELGIPAHEARRFGSEIQRDFVLVGVRCADTQSETTARRLLRDSGGQDIAALRTHPF